MKRSHRAPQRRLVKSPEQKAQAKQRTQALDFELEPIFQALAQGPHQYHKTFKRHLYDIERLTLDPGFADYRFNAKLAKTYIIVIEKFRHFKGSEFAGRPLLLEDWQKALVAILFGWQKKGKRGWVRRFNTAFIYMARKNAKTTLLAAMAIADLLITKEAQAEIVFASVKRDLAKIAWGGALSLIEAQPDLKRRFSKSGYTLTYTDKSTITTLGRDSNEDGRNISFGGIDEVHLLPDTSIIDVVKSSMGSREQPLLTMITTAGFNIASPITHELDYSHLILDNIGSTKYDEIYHTDSYFTFLAEPYEKQEPLSMEALIAANPNIDVSVSVEFLEQELNMAKQRPEKRVNFITKHVNQMVNASQTFIKIEDWKACAIQTPDLTKAKYLIIGMDLSVSDDWTSLSNVWLFNDEANTLFIEPMAYIPGADLGERGRNLRVPLQSWVDQGYVKTAGSKTIDFNIIYDDIVATITKASKHGIPVILAYDPYKAKTIINKLDSKFGFTNVVAVNQGFLTQTEALAMLSNKTRDRTIKHGNVPTLNWHLSNIEIIYDRYGNMKTDRSAPYKKIDIVAATLNSLYAYIPIINEEEASLEPIFV